MRWVGSSIFCEVKGGREGGAHGKRDLASREAKIIFFSVSFDWIRVSKLTHWKCRLLVKSSAAVQPSNLCTDINHVNGDVVVLSLPGQILQKTLRRNVTNRLLPPAIKPEETIGGTNISGNTQDLVHIRPPLYRSLVLTVVTAVTVVTVAVVGNR